MTTTQLPVLDPATREIIGTVPQSGAAEIDRAVAGAREAFETWSRVPVVERARLMFRFADALERRREELAISVARENGKTIDDARAEVRRGIEAVEFAGGMPSLMMGDALPDVARGIDSISVRYPLGVCAGITPFNFPAMIPLWMAPIAIAAGNAFVLKPSPQTPLTANSSRQPRRSAAFHRISSPSCTAARKPSKHSSTIPASPPYRSSDRRRSRAACTSALRTHTNACKHSAARRTISW